MKSSRTLFLSALVAIPVLGGAVLFGRAAHSQPPGGPPSFGGRPASAGSYKPSVRIEVKGDYRFITSNGIPNHATGRFPNQGNPNSISPQDYHFRVPLHPKAADRPTPSQLFGVAVNGVVFDPGTAELWNGDFRWHYEALTGLLGTQGRLGADDNFAHVQPNGAYHYHGLPMGLLKKLDYTHRMALVGYAGDGFPIYGPYIYATPNSPQSGLKPARSSYRVKEGNRPGGADGPGGAYDGSFASDYEYVKGLGDLDAFNGRTGVTPEYPQGTFYYVLTSTWPFVPRMFRGVPDASFRKGPGGPGFGQGRPGGGPGGPGFGPGGPGGGPGFGPGGPGGPGFGPPPGFVPGEMLAPYLGLSAAQQAKVARLVKAIDALRRENLALRALPQLKLTPDQIDRIAAGSKVRDVLTVAQKRVMDANPRPQFPGPGGPGGGPGGPPGGPGFGGQGGPPVGGPGGLPPGGG